jgi:hypothetical protein
MTDGVLLTTYYVGNTGPRSMDELKKNTIIYYGDGEADRATEMAQSERAGGNIAKTRDALAFDGAVELCNNVVILDSVPSARRQLIEKVYEGFFRPERGSEKWDGGKVSSGDGEGGGQVVDPGGPLIVTGPKVPPGEVTEEVSRGVADVNLTPKFEPTADPVDERAQREQRNAARREKKRQRQQG